MPALPPLPDLETMTAWTEAELLAAIQVYGDADWVFSFEEEGETGVWAGTFYDAEGKVLFETRYPERRISLMNAYGFIWRRLYKPTNPVWQRRRDDLRVAARSGLMHLPGQENVPDPDDLNPASVYDVDPTRRTR